MFEYIGVLISVIMGLGITHLAIGASKLIQNRDTVRFYLPHALWTVNVLMYILLIWWAMFWWSGHTTWLAHEYRFITCYAIMLFFLASMLYPWDMDKEIDVRAYFFRNRRWFFGALFLAWCLDVPETVFKASADLRELPPEYFVFVSTLLTIAATGFFVRNRVVHLLLPIAYFGIKIYYVSMTLVGRIST